LRSGAQHFAREGFRFEPDLVLVGFFVGNDTYGSALSVRSLPTSVGGRRISREAAGFRADPRCLYNDTTHWNPEGHALAAKLLGAELISWT
jgi:hypothetical protein